MPLQHNNRSIFRLAAGKLTEKAICVLKKCHCGQQPCIEIAQCTRHFIRYSTYKCAASSDRHHLNKILTNSDVNITMKKKNLRVDESSRFVSVAQLSAYYTINVYYVLIGLIIAIYCQHNLVV